MSRTHAAWGASMSRNSPRRFRARQDSIRTVATLRRRARHLMSRAAVISPAAPVLSVRRLCRAITAWLRDYTTAPRTRCYFRCGATTRAGRPCEARPTVEGGIPRRRCRHHGGAVMPQRSVAQWAEDIQELRRRVEELAA